MRKKNTSALSGEDSKETEAMESNPPLSKSHPSMGENSQKSAIFLEDGTEISSHLEKMAKGEQKISTPRESKDDLLRTNGPSKHPEMVRRNSMRRRINGKGISFESSHFLSNFRYLFRRLLNAIGSIFTVPYGLLRLLFTPSFFQKSAKFLMDCPRSLVEKIEIVIDQCFHVIRSCFRVLCRLFKSIFDKIISIYSPNTWIQGLAIFLIKSSAMAASCCLLIMVARHSFPGFSFLNRSSSHSSNGQSQSPSLDKDASPERGLKHLFRDPLVLQRGKIQSALLSFHVDRIQRRGDGSG
ncbi:MAG: hypothetical protein LBI77_04195, partial [Puniceicoccales bacterium]|nr:hypothetical protein [Puniceicoccales bacterium]